MVGCDKNFNKNRCFSIYKNKDINEFLKTYCFDFKYFAIFINAVTRNIKQLIY